MTFSITLEVPKSRWSEKSWYHCWEGAECHWIYQTPQEAFEFFAQKYPHVPIQVNIQPAVRSTDKASPFGSENDHLSQPPFLP